MNSNGPTFLGLGSNLGDRLRYLIDALDLIADQVHPLEISPIYETDPVGYKEQPPFLNAVCSIKSAMSPRELLASMSSIEVSLGRQRTDRWRARKIDIDIIAMGALSISTDDLTIPHRRLAERLFVCQPFADIAPDFVPPGIGTPVADLCDVLVGGPAVKRWMAADRIAASLRSPQWRPASGASVKSSKRTGASLGGIGA